jgi:hypothetical protein
MLNCPQGVHDFLRAYYHMKSADWKQNKPFPLESWSAAELAKLPTYYIMDLDKGMAETVAQHMPSLEEIAGCNWLTEEELHVYSSEYTRTGFQGGLQWYRSARDARGGEQAPDRIPAAEITPGSFKMDADLLHLWHNTIPGRFPFHYPGEIKAGQGGSLLPGIFFKIFKMQINPALAGCPCPSYGK